MWCRIGIVRRPGAARDIGAAVRPGLPASVRAEEVRLGRFVARCQRVRKAHGEPVPPPSCVPCRAAEWPGHRARDSRMLAGAGGHLRRGPAARPDARSERRLELHQPSDLPTDAGTCRCRSSPGSATSSGAPPARFRSDRASWTTGLPPPRTKRWSAFSRSRRGTSTSTAWGIPELRERIAVRLAVENGIDADRFALMVTAGGNMAFLTALLAICDQGDEVVLVRPYFFNHEMAVRMIGCRPVVVAADERYQLDLAAIEAAIGPRTRAVVTVSPNNPSGAVYPESDLRAVNALCADRGLFHLSDEVYEYFVFDGARHFSPGSIAGAEDHTVCIYSLSKSYGFASWRVGYMLLPIPLLETVEKIQDTNVICAPAVSQHAAVGVLDAGRKWVEERPRIHRGGAPDRPRCPVRPRRAGDGAAGGRGVLLPRPRASGRGFGRARRAADPQAPDRGDSGHGVRHGRRMLPAGRLRRGGTPRRWSRAWTGSSPGSGPSMRGERMGAPRSDLRRRGVHSGAGSSPRNPSCRHAS